MTKCFLFLPFLSLFIIHCHPDSKEEIRDFTHAFDEYNVEGTFVLYDLQQDQYIRHNPERCNLPVIPASTFKIFNSLVSLETGAVEDANFFATNIEMDQPEDSFAQARKAVSLNILKELGILG